MAEYQSMTAQEVLKTVAEMPYEDWVEIQCGIADLMMAQFSSQEIAEINEALAESEAEYQRGESMTGEEIRKRLGLL